MFQKFVFFVCCIYGSLAVDGNWSQWGLWGDCSKTCASGNRYRSRSCSDPFPSFNGAPCPGDSQESQTCNTNTCPAINGAWSNWGDWGACSINCGSGTKTRTRLCTNPAPAYGGAQCSSSNVESQTDICTGPCSVDGVWGAWGSYGPCTHTCGGGKQARRRTCNNPAPSNGGLTCPGATYDVASCSTTPCPVPAAGSYVQYCPTSYFTCQSGTVACINDTLKCDCKNHCSDASDETTGYASCPSPPKCAACDIKTSVLFFLLIMFVRQSVLECVLDSI